MGQYIDLQEPEIVPRYGMANAALLVGLQLNLVQGRDDLFTDEFD